MAFSYHFPPTAFTVAQYDEAVKRLTAAGARHPKGRTYHVCFGERARSLAIDLDPLVTLIAIDLFLFNLPRSAAPLPRRLHMQVSDDC